MTIQELAIKANTGYHKLDDEYSLLKPTLENEYWKEIIPNIDKRAK